jgi:hypothetical protein
MNIEDTLAPTSDQLDAVDLLGGPRTFTIENVGRNNSPEQPLNVKLAEFPRVWRPGKSMRRVLAFAWGTDASKYTGRRVTLYCDPEVTFGKDRVGGTRISHLSHIDKALSIPLLVTRGKSKVFTVQPLKEQPASVAEPTAEEVAACTDRGRLAAMWRASSPERREQIEARVKALEPTPHAFLWDTENDGNACGVEGCGLTEDADIHQEAS